MENCGGYSGFEDEDDDFREDQIYSGSLDECLVWSALGSAFAKSHDWAVVVTESLPNPAWLGREGEVSRLVEGQAVPFAPMTLAGWLVRPGTGEQFECLVVLVFANT